MKDAIQMGIVVLCVLVLIFVSLDLYKKFTPEKVYYSSLYSPRLGVVKFSRPILQTPDVDYLLTIFLSEEANNDPESYSPQQP